MAKSADPYYIVQDETAETLRGVQEKFAEWKALAPGAAKRTALQEELEEECYSLEYMLLEINKAIDAAEANPARFRLSQAELSERRAWTLTTRRSVDSVRAGLNAPPPPSTTATPSARLAAAAHSDNERFLESEGQRQQTLLARQDVELDHLGDHVVRIGELGREMGTELHTQGQLLDELDEEMEGTHTRLAAAQKKVQHVLDRAGGRGQLAIIGILIVLLVMLIILVLA